MKLSLPFVCLAMAATMLGVAAHDEPRARGLWKKKGKSKKGNMRGGKKKGGKRGGGGGYYYPKIQHLDLTFINMAYQQPFSPFFIMIHSADVTPLYIRGQAASDELARLAEDGDPLPLVEAYKDVEGVYDVLTTDLETGLFVGEVLTVSVKVPEDCVVTLASMAIHTNDCFCALNGEEVYPEQVFDLDGLDSGTEENNELCSSIPGPACDEFESGNTADGNGEGVVHVHRGFHGVGGDLTEAGYDWRNPMLRVIVTKTEKEEEEKEYTGTDW